jgi:hypothetical protein
MAWMELMARDLMEAIGRFPNDSLFLPSTKAA